MVMLAPMVSRRRRNSSPVQRGGRERARAEVLLVPPWVPLGRAALARARALREAGQPTCIIHHSNVLATYLWANRPGSISGFTVRSYRGFVSRLWEEALGTECEWTDGWTPDLELFIDSLLRLDMLPTPHRPHLIIVDGQGLPRSFYRALRILRIGASVLVDESRPVAQETSSTADEICRVLGLPSPLRLSGPAVCTSPVQEFAKSLDPGPPRDQAPGSSRLGSRPRLMQAADLEAAAAVLERARQAPQHRIGVLVQHTAQVERFQQLLLRCGARRVGWYTYNRAAPQSARIDFLRPGISVLTWASAHCVDFDDVFIPELQSVTSPPYVFHGELARLSATAADNLVLSYSGEGEPPLLRALSERFVDRVPAGFDAPPQPAPPSEEEDHAEEELPAVGELADPPLPADVGAVQDLDLDAALAAARRRLRRDRRLHRLAKELLVAEEEVGLAIAMRGDAVPLSTALPPGFRTGLGDDDERAQAFDSLVGHNLRLVGSMVRHYLGQGLDEDDLFQHGVLGLMRAAERFDGGKGNKFSTYAVWWIRQSVTRALADEGSVIRMPVHVHERVSKVKRLRRELTASGGDTRPDRLAELADLPVEKVLEYLRLAVGVVSLDQPAQSDADVTLGDLVLVQNSDEDVDRVMDREWTKELVDAALAALPERQATILRLRFGFDGGDELTLAEIGDQLGVTRERIRQIEVKAKVRLREELARLGLLAATSDEEPEPLSVAAATTRHGSTIPTPAEPAVRLARGETFAAGIKPLTGIRATRHGSIQRTLLEYIDQRALAGAQHISIRSIGTPGCESLALLDDGPDGPSALLTTWAELTEVPDHEGTQDPARRPGPLLVEDALLICDEIVMQDDRQSAESTCTVLTTAPLTGQWWLSSAALTFTEPPVLSGNRTSRQVTVLKGIHRRLGGSQLATALAETVDRLAVLHNERLVSKRVRIHVNGAPVMARDLFLERHPASQDLGTEHVMADGHSAAISLRILPHPDRLSAEDLSAAGDPDLWPREQGFYVRCADRFVYAGGWLDLPDLASAEETSLARIIVDIDESELEAWRPVARQGQVTVPTPLRERLSMLADLARRRAMQVHAYRQAEDSSQTFDAVQPGIHTRAEPASRSLEEAQVG